MTSAVYQGDLAILYRADRADDVLLKVTREPADNDLIQREARALAKLAEDGDPRYLPYVPRLVESLRIKDPDTGVVRRANLIGTVPALHSLAEVQSAYPDGLDPRDAAWMWRRLLVAVGLAHRCGVVHGAVLPEHVLIQPEEHGLVLIDWCYSVIDPGERVPALVSRYADWYPAEVPGRQEVGPGTDIAMVARCMRELIGPRIPRQLAAFAAGCQLPRLAQRPDNAWKLLGEFDELLDRLYGPRRFRPFHLPPKTTITPTSDSATSDSAGSDSTGSDTEEARHGKRSMVN